MLTFPLVIAIIIGLIIFGIYRKFRKKRTYNEELFFSREDLTSQLLFLLSIFFLGEVLLSIGFKLARVFNTSGESVALSLGFLVLFVGILIAYYFKMIFVLTVNLAGITVWWAYQLLWWIEDSNVESSILPVSLFFMSVLIYFLGRLHKKMGLKRAGRVYLILGILWITSILFLLSMKEGLAMLEKTEEQLSFFVSGRIMVSFISLVILSFGMWLYGIWRKLVSRSEAAFTGVLMILFLVINFIPFQGVFLKEAYGWANLLSEVGIFWITFFNLLLFVEIAWVIIQGYFSKERQFVNLGVGFVVIILLVKYFTMAFSFLEKSVFFITTGILLLGIGFVMEKGRRYLISSFEKEENNQG